MTGIEGAVLDIDREALALTVAAAEDLLALVNEEMGLYLEGVNRFYDFCDQIKPQGGER